MFEEFRKILADQLEIDINKINKDSELSADLGINSLELADLLLICENNYDIEISDNDIRKFITVGDVANYLEAATVHAE